jgi:hypothetical protein
MAKRTGKTPAKRAARAASAAARGARKTPARRPAGPARAAAKAPRAPGARKRAKGAVAAVPARKTKKKASAGTRRAPDRDLAVATPGLAAARPRPVPVLPGPTSSLDLDRLDARAPLGAIDEDLLTTDELTAGDFDASVQAAHLTGDETPGGENPTPDQDVVDLIGRSLGVEYDDSEELRGADKIADRDRHRWELDPASSEDYRERGR